MADFERKKHNPIELINAYWPEASTNHIVYDPNMKAGDYEIIRESGGDGTLLFTVQMLKEALVHLVNMKSYYAKEPPRDWGEVAGIRYTVGPARHAVVYGRIYLRCSKTHKYPGQRERVRISVKSEFVYKNSIKRGGQK